MRMEIKSEGVKLVTVDIVKTADSVKKRRPVGRARGLASVEQVHACHDWSTRRVSVPERRAWEHGFQ